MYIENKNGLVVIDAAAKKLPRGGCRELLNRGDRLRGAGTPMFVAYHSSHVDYVRDTSVYI
jgi:hypothetical protein